MGVKIGTTTSRMAAQSMNMPRKKTTAIMIASTT